MKKQISGASFFSVALGAALVVAAVYAATWVPEAHADSAEFSTAPSNPTPRHGIGNTVCGPIDPTCRDHLQTILSDVRILTMQAEGGVMFGGSHANAAIKFSAQGLNSENESGDVRLLMFDAAYLSQEQSGGIPNAFRVRFSLADTEVLFMCKDEKGKVAPPVAATLLVDCVPNGAFAYVGAGGKLVQIQWDVATKRVAARWGEIHAVLNLLGNANSESYLKAQLQAYAGASVDTVWYGKTPGTNGGSSTVPRGTFGLTGMIRSTDLHWEVRGMAGLRPNFTSSSDFSIETRAQALYHLLLSGTTMMDIGVDGQYHLNTVPANSIGDFVSDRDKSSAYLGGVLGFTFQ